ncbi:MAG: hypothetical protein AAB074_04375 [Planctomycetota bacterium]
MAGLPPFEVAESTYAAAKFRKVKGLEDLKRLVEALKPKTAKEEKAAKRA